MHANEKLPTGYSTALLHRAAALKRLLGRIPSSVVINLLVPLLIYRFLTNHGATDLEALLVAGAVPAVDVAWGWLRHRHVSAIGLVALGTVAAGAVAGVLSDNPFFVLIRDSFVFAVLALACWGSLLLRRPLSFVLGRAAAGARGQAAAQAYAARWDDDAFRRRQRAVTFVWGMGFLALAGIRTVMAVVVPVSWFLVLAPATTLVVAGGLVLWTWRSGEGGLASFSADRAGAPQG